MTSNILACDLDGVIFNFNESYTKWLNNRFGCSIPKDGKEYPDTWHYATDGKHVTKEQEKEFWNWSGGEGCYEFWSNLKPYPTAEEFLAQAFQKFDDVYFITTRPGSEAKRAAEDALKAIGVKDPKVIISFSKGPDIAATGATHFLDDRDKNFEDCISFGLNDNANNPLEMFILDHPWNRHYDHPWVSRIYKIEEVFKCLN